MQKTTLILALLLLLTGGLAACGGDDGEDAARDAATAVTDTAGAQETLEDAIDTVEGQVTDALTRDLEEQNGSGISGTVELEPQSQDQIRVTIELEGDEAGASYPAHIHPGSCANLDPKPEYPLENVQDGTSETTVDASPLEVFTGEYAVNVHDPDDTDRYVACADIPSTED
jgi:hypothetical protein